jgi:hypothetical protein
MEDISAQILESWGQPLNALPSIADLDMILSTPLPEPIPISPAQLLPDPTPDADVISHSEHSASQLDAIRFFITCYHHDGTSEASWIPFLDGLIKGVMSLLARKHSLGLFFDRNTIDFSRTIKGAGRPDLLCWLPNGMLGFKGEEKAEISCFDMAADELLGKLAKVDPLFFGNLPY